MFAPQFTISSHMLENIKHIAVLADQLNRDCLSGPVHMKALAKARALSIFASTSIEGNPLPLTEVKRLLKTRPQQLRDSEREIINYNHALEELATEMRSGNITWDIPFIEHVHQLITTKLLTGSRCGKLRNEAVFVNDPRSGQPVYLPPDHHDVPQLMNELLAFINAHRGSLDPLLLAGLFHKQFVIIHPFLDGNGRTTRVLTSVLLADMGLQLHDIMSFENYYNHDVSRYFAQVGLFGNYYELEGSIDFTTWLEYFTAGIVDELLRIQKQLQQDAVRHAPRFAEHHHTILSYIDQHGSITDREYAKLTERAKATRSLDFKFLLEHHLLERHGKGKNTYYTRLPHE